MNPGVAFFKLFVGIRSVENIFSSRWGLLGFYAGDSFLT
jgi:hypothetical protein